MSGITDREPFAWTWETRQGMWTCITARDNAEFCVEPEGHVERDTPVWLVSADDLTARDEAVRRKVLAEVERRITTVDPGVGIGTGPRHPSTLALVRSMLAEGAES